MDETIGLIPAAGYANRISPLPCSKELYPVGFRTVENQRRPKVVSHYLLEKMRHAGITRAYMVLRKEKWDIPAYFTDGSIVGMNLAYLMVGRSYGVPFTLDYAYPFVRQARVAFGFPDILFSSEDAFVKLLNQHSRTQPDIILGLLPAADSSTFDRVDFDKNGIVQGFYAGPYNGPLPYSWAIAVWSPSFTEFLHRYTHERAVAAAQAPELSAGHAIEAALENKLHVESMIVGDEPYLDIGTPADLVKAIRARSG